MKRIFDWLFVVVVVKKCKKEMDRYQRVEKPKAETIINENKIQITMQGRMRNYITYATTLLQVPPCSSWLGFF